MPPDSTPTSSHQLSPSLPADPQMLLLATDTPPELEELPPLNTNEMAGDESNEMSFTRRTSRTLKSVGTAKQKSLQSLMRDLRLDGRDDGGSNTVHPFWDTQPVPKMSECPTCERRGPIDPVMSPENVREEPYKLPEGFVWSECDVHNDSDLQEIYHLLHEHYVEDDDNLFRFDYSKHFIIWALTPPGYFKDWVIGVRVASTNKLVAFISATPARIGMRSDDIPVAEINYLCIHKKLRSKRLTPVLIKEVTRRVNKRDTWQAVYTAGVVLPKPLVKCRYWHRSLDVKKLVEIGFSSLNRRLTMSRAIRLYKVSEATKIEGIREMREDDVTQVHKILSEHLRKYVMQPKMSEEDCRHWLLPREDVLFSYVKEQDGEVTDFLSFYSLPSTVIGNEKHKTLKAAYLFYNVANTVDLKDLIGDAFVIARSKGFDVFNALDIMDNSSFMKELKFGIGDGYLRYYLFNWRCAELRPEEVGLVLL